MRGEEKERKKKTQNRKRKIFKFIQRYKNPIIQKKKRELSFYFSFFPGCKEGRRGRGDGDGNGGWEKRNNLVGLEKSFARLSNNLVIIFL